MNHSIFYNLSEGELATWQQRSKVWQLSEKLDGQSTFDWHKAKDFGKADYETIVTLNARQDWGSLIEFIHRWDKSFVIRVIMGTNPDPALEPKTKSEPKTTNPLIAQLEEIYRDNERLKEEILSLEEDKKDLHQMIEELKKKPKTQTYTPKTAHFIKPYWYDKAVNMLKAWPNLLLTGGRGTGKSYTAQEIGKTLGLENFTPVSLSGGVTYEKVFGGKAIQNGQTYFEKGIVLQAIVKPGLLLLDECLQCDPDVATAFNPITEPGQGYFVTPEGEKIERHKDCYIIATSNTNGRQLSDTYGAVQIQDSSLLGRFIELSVDYDPKLEAAILKDMEIDQNVIDYLTANIYELRKQCKISNINYDACTRKLIQTTNLITQGFSNKESFETVFLAPLSIAERSKISLEL